MTDQAAERLGLSRRTVERKIEQGAIPAFQPGGTGTAIRIDEGARYSWRRRGTLKILVPRVVSENGSLPSRWARARW
jgi:excisionase family DNA binding protein